MRSVRGKTAHLLEGQLEPGEGFVEHRRELPEFIVWIVHREAILQTVGRNGAGAFRHSLDRRQCTACKRVPPKPGSCDAEWQTEQKHEQELMHILQERRFRSGDLNDDGSATDP